MGPTPRRSAGTKFWWSNDLEERLISLWEGTPFLYNIQFRDYANTQKRGLKTIEFAEQLNVPIEEVRRHLHSLRSQFRRDQNRLKKATSNSAPIQLSARSSFLQQRLSFLLGHMKQSPTRYISPEVPVSSDEPAQRPQQDDWDDSQSTNLSDADTPEDTEDNKLNILSSVTTTMHDNVTQDEEEEMLWAKLCGRKMKKVWNQSTKYRLMNYIDGLINKTIEGIWVPPLENGPVSPPQEQTQ